MNDTPDTTNDDSVDKTRIIGDERTLDSGEMTSAMGTDPAGGPTEGGFLSDRLLVPNEPDRYTGHTFIGAGGIGVIQAVRDPNLGRVVARKTLQARHARVTHVRERFIREAQIMSQLEHPNIVPVHEIGLSAEGAVYFTMKRVHGVSLDTILNHLGSNDEEYVRRYPPTRLIDIFLSICHAVAFAHSRNVIHRDLKPDNILIGEFGEVQIMDWGLVKQIGKPPDADEQEGGPVEGPEGGSTTTTMEGQVAGTPLYMSPEQARGDIASLDGRSDLYSLGAILYHILTLETYIPSNLPVPDLLRLVKTAVPTPPAKLAPNRGIPRELSAICMKALAKRQEDRYASVRVMIEDINRFRAGLSVDVCPEGPGRRFWKLCRRHPVVSSSVAAAAVAALVLIVTAGWVRHARFETAMAEGERYMEYGNTALARADQALSLLEQTRDGRKLKLKTPDEIRYEQDTRRSLKEAESYYDVAALFFAQAGNLRSIRGGWMLRSMFGSQTGGVTTGGDLRADDRKARRLFMHVFEANQRRIDFNIRLNDEAEVRRLLAFLRVTTRRQDAWLTPDMRCWLGDAEKWLAGESEIAIQTRPPGATVQRARLNPDDGSASPALDIGTSPTVPVTVAQGSYLLTLTLPDRPPLSVPLRIARSAAETVTIPIPESIPDGMSYVPGGPCILGGDRSAYFRQREETIPSFFIKTTEVTFGDYLEFWRTLDDPVAREECASYVQLDEGAFCKIPAWNAAGELIPGLEAGMPAVGITQPAAVRYCEWLSARLGKTCRLPTADEWEKAARGVDGREFVWGNTYEPSRCYTFENRDARKKYPFYAPPGSFPGDRSVYGVLDLAGNVREWTASTFPADRGFQIKGGSLATGERFLYCANASDTPVVPSDVGFRYITPAEE